jgi:ADP-ribose pyrophosphatase YjhB (NUDIX family)
MERHFTTSVYIFHENEVLLHYHKKLNTYLPPGGHLEPNETPPEAARREVLEETGLEIEFISQEQMSINAPNAASFEKPYLCLLENIPVYKDEPAHQHIDFVYLARPKHGKSLVDGFQWFKYEDLANLSLFPDVQEVLKQLLSPALL